MAKKAETDKKRPEGRPERVLNAQEIDRVHELAQCDGTYEEISAMLGIAINTFRACMERQPEAKVAYDTGRSKLRVGLKQALIEEGRGIDPRPLKDKDGKPIKVRKRNVIALIFATKNICDYRDKREVENKDGSYEQTIKERLDEARRLVEQSEKDAEGLGEPKP